MKKIVLTALPVVMLSVSYAQTLFTYGNNVVTKSEFVRAFNKNPTVTTDRKSALKEYLDLYVNFKLKVKAAYDSRLHEDPTQLAELSNFRQQIADNIINEEARVSDLVTEAFYRSQKDIHLAQVFIEVPAKGDTLDAYKKIQAAYQELKTGKDFGKVSAEFSSDAYTKQSEGDLGFITVFTLPYEFETVAYSTKPNTFSIPFKTKLGYHIFKNIGERKPLGSRRVAQILIAVPPNGSEVEKAAAARKADSVYSLAKSGKSFAELARTVSNDMSSANSDGLLTEFGIGVYNPEFEKVAFELKTPGELSKPFATTYGFHILKLVQAIPAGIDITNVETLAALQEKVQKDDRLALAKKSMIDKQISLIKYRPAPFDQSELWRFTDSAVNGKSTAGLKLNGKTLLFSYASQKLTASDWCNYVRTVRGSSVENSGKNYSDLMKDYIKETAADYYKNHLDDYSPEFKKQVQEFKEANLLFGIMDVNVWGKANVDTNGLKAYYNQHKNKYTWSLSADALIVTCTNDSIVSELQERLKQTPEDWRSIVDGYASQVTADSGRYELGQLPVVDRTNFQPGLATAPVKNQTDNSVTFNYIFNLHNQQEPRNFEDAKGMVISDYQQVLEDKWIAELKKKYPVKVNMAVFNTIK
jgi:peptidyl-prolyl cis-trans isomerase SurA